MVAELAKGLAVGSASYVRNPFDQDVLLCQVRLDAGLSSPMPEITKRFLTFTVELREMRIGLAGRLDVL